MNSIISLFLPLLTVICEQYGHHPYMQRKAAVRQGTDLCFEEQQYRAARVPYIKNACEKLVGHTLQDHQVPRIAFCGSGGGYRAMIATLGFLKGASKIGLLPATLYNSTVSGSSWAVAALVQSGMSVEKYSEQLPLQINTPITQGNNNNQLMHALLKQFACTQTITLVDLYGALLAQKLLSKMGNGNPLNIGFEEHVKFIRRTDMPMPIYSAIMSRSYDNGYLWTEFTPYEVGSWYLKSFIPSWAFGRRFCSGNSIDFDPPQSLGFLMGLWGSALSRNLHDIIRLYKDCLGDSAFAWELVIDFLSYITLLKDSVYPVYVANWMLALDGVCKEQEWNMMFDATLELGLALPPLLRPERGVDIIVICDATHCGINSCCATHCDAPHAEAFSELRKAQLYAQRHGLKFPPIGDLQENEPCSIHFDDDDPTAPVVIYIPLKADQQYQQGWDPAQDFTHIFNFQYDQEQVKLLSGLMEHAVVASKKVIIEAIERVVARKQITRLVV